MRKKHSVVRASSMSRRRHAITASARHTSFGRRYIRAAAESGVMIKTETAEGTYYLAKSATKKKTFWTEKFDSANKFAKKDSALNKLYTVLTRLEENAFYDADDMYDIETEADLKKAKFAKFYITDLSGKTIEDISTEVKNHMLSVDAFVSAVLDDFDDEDDIEESTRIRGRRSIKASNGRYIDYNDPHDAAFKIAHDIADYLRSKFHKTTAYDGVDIEVEYPDYDSSVPIFDVDFYCDDYRNETRIKVVVDPEYPDAVFYTEGNGVRKGSYKEISRYGSGEKLAKIVDEIARRISDESVNAAKSIKCAAWSEDNSVDPIDSNIMVNLYYSPNHRGLAGDRYFYDWSEAESYAHDALMNGLYVSIWNRNNGDILDISPDEYNDAWENGAADFDINEDIVRFKDRIVNSAKSVKCSTKRRRSIKASIGDDVYADDIKDVIRNAGIKVLDVKKSRTHISDSFFSILLDNTNDFHAVVDAITDAGYGVTYDYPAVDGNWMYIMISDNREDDAFLYRVVYEYQSEVVPMDDETSDYQAVLDACIDMKEARGDKDLYTMDEVEAEGWYEDEYVTGGNRGLALYTGGNFNIEPIGRGKLSEYVGSSTRLTAARDTTVDKDAVRELVLYITNDASLYPQVQAIVKNMKQKIKRGKYDDELAVRAWQYLADAGVAKYDKEFGSGGGTKAMLNKATREQIARELRDEYADMVNEDVEASEGLVTM